MIYKDGRGGASYVKRFAVTGVTRDKEYDLTQAKKGSEALYFSANPNGEAEIVSIYLRSGVSAKKLKFDLDFSDLLIKGRGVKGNRVTTYAVKKVELKQAGVSTLKPRKIWFDETVQRLNVDGRGDLLGEFKGEDRLLIISQKGEVKTIIPELTVHFTNDMIVLEKWNPKKPISAVYYDGEKERYYVKRFLIEQEGKTETFISDHINSQLEIVSTDYLPQVEVVFYKQRGKDQKPNEIVNLAEFIAIKGIKALGNQLTTDKVKQINLLDPLPYEPEVSEEETNDTKPSPSVDDIDLNSTDGNGEDAGEQATLF